MRELRKLSSTPCYPPLLGDFYLGWGTPPNPRQEESCTSFLEEIKSTSCADAAGTRSERIADLAYWLVERAEASGANVGLHLLPVKDDGLLVSVSLPLAVGAPLGMAHVVPELYRFFAYITFAWHRIPFDQTVVLR